MIRFQTLSKQTKLVRCYITLLLGQTHKCCNLNLFPPGALGVWCLVSGV